MFTGTIFKSGRGVLLALGGAFLLIKAMSDLKQHRNKEENAGLTRLDNQTPSLVEIIIYDALLSIDSVIAALALANNLHLVLIAMLLAHVFLNVFWKQIDDFFLERPSMMTITLSFVFVLGLVSMVRILGVVLAEETLVAALLFAIMVEFLNGGRTKQKLTTSTARERIRSYSERRLANSAPDADGSFASMGDSMPVVSSISEKVPENPFAALTCSSCNSTTYSAFQFCISCGHTKQPA